MKFINIRYNNIYKYLNELSLFDIEWHNSMFNFTYIQLSLLNEHKMAVSMSKHNTYSNKII